MLKNFYRDYIGYLYRDIKNRLYIVGHEIRTLFVLFSFLLCQWSVAQQTVSSGKLVEYPLFKSAIVAPRDVFVWLPSDYSPENRYDVIYMHDGQMLFDAASTWNKVDGEWMRFWENCWKRKR